MERGTVPNWAVKREKAGKEVQKIEKEDWSVAVWILKR